MKNIAVICSLLLCSSAAAASNAQLTGPYRSTVADTTSISYTLTLSFENDGKKESVEINVDKTAFDAAVIGQPFTPGLPMIVIAKNAKAR